jgi:hypothetical protein
MDDSIKIKSLLVFKEHSFGLPSIDKSVEF